ncbi:MAG TPA: hypothetical protein VFY49_03880 [Myxococcota bacterium]|nr:hypothetical protein [Myxococcota bacterium]
MSADREIVARHVAALRAEGERAGIPSDVIGRLLLEQVVEIWLGSRTREDVARQLVFTAENLDPDADFTFMRP